jgi:hypothetical protein
MTIQELNDLIARGAAQPGVHEAVEVMRLSQELDRQARELVEIYGAVSTSAMTSSSGVVTSGETTAAGNHAKLG